MSVPQIINAGTTTKFTYSDSRYTPSDGWVMTIYLVGKSALSNVAVVNGNEYQFTISATKTTNLPEQYMNWELRASKAATGEVYLVHAGNLQVRPDFSQLTTNQLPEEKMLGYIRAQMEGRLSAVAAVDALSISDRRIQFMNMKELREMEAEWTERLYALRHRGTAGRVKFTGFGNGYI